MRFAPLRPRLAAGFGRRGLGESTQAAYLDAEAWLVNKRG